jgi:anti-anti-sigma factor
MAERAHLRIIPPPAPPAPPGGEVAVFVEADDVVILLRGDIDLTMAADLEDAAGSAIEQQLPIVVDVRHVELFDSVGLSFLVRLAAAVRTAGGTLTLCGPAPRVDELLGVTGSRGLFRWVEGREGPGGAPTP